MKSVRASRTLICLLALLGGFSLLSSSRQDPLGDLQDLQDLEERLRRGLKDRAADFWIYDDLKEGFALARKTGKPLLLSFRCVP